jgi:hypothetical protein
MNVITVFVSVNAKNFEMQSDWWARLLERRWDREPMPSCHEWDLIDGVLFQVLDNPNGARTAVTLMVSDLDAHVTRLRSVGVEIADPTKVAGFDTLRYAAFSDPEANPVGLLEGH